MLLHTRPQDGTWQMKPSDRLIAAGAGRPSPRSDVPTGNLTEFGGHQNEGISGLEAALGTSDEESYWASISARGPRLRASGGGLRASMSIISEKKRGGGVGREGGVGRGLAPSSDRVFPSIAVSKGSGGVEGRYRRVSRSIDSCGAPILWVCKKGDKPYAERELPSSSGGGDISDAGPSLGPIGGS